jgi:subtilase family serine protease
MSKPVGVSSVLSAILSIATSFGAMQAPHATMLRQGDMLIPESSVVRPGDFGWRAHTNHVILAPEVAGALPRARVVEAVADAASVPQPRGESPASLRAVYGLPSTGGAGTIAIVDAYDAPTVERDLAVFSSTYGLRACTTANGCFRRVYASGVKPALNCGWAQETALDVEWAHAMAPNARIVLVEAASSNSTDLLRAVDLASSIVSPGGKGFGEVSMSWGFGEFSGEKTLDSHFNRPGVVFVASSGDVGGARQYPATSPQVIAAGGTTVQRDSTGRFVGETAWSGSGGGPSTFEIRPQYQDRVVSKVGSRRGVPDVSFNANPYSGVAVYDSTACQGLVGWLVFGGTSVSAPALAGVVNLAGHFYQSSNLELGVIYSHLGTTVFRDITSGRAGIFGAVKGWDFVTGVGSSVGLSGK